MNELIERVREPQKIENQIFFVNSEIDRAFLQKKVARAAGANSGTMALHDEVITMYRFIADNLAKLLGSNDNCNDLSLQKEVYKLETKNCEHCKKEFVPKTSKTRFCSGSCRVGSHRAGTRTPST